MTAPPLEQVSAALERIIRPIVEGQIRGFLKEHPVIIEAVDWYKPRRDKATTFVNSLSKRIVRDLTCGMVSARLETALLELATDAPLDSTVEDASAAKPDRLAFSLSDLVPYRERRAIILRTAPRHSSNYLAASSPPGVVSRLAAPPERETTGGAAPFTAVEGLSGP